jgi:hypothetical protein
VKIDWNISDDTYFLEVKESTVEDSGKYTVTIGNKYGKVEESVDVSVKMPEAEVKEEEVTVEEAPKVEKTKEQTPEPVEEEPVEEVKLPEFSSKPEAVSVVEGESILIKFKLTEGTKGSMLPYPCAYSRFLSAGMKLPCDDNMLLMFVVHIN